MPKINKNFRGIFKENQPLASYTSWRIGGPAQYFYRPADLDDLVMFLKKWQAEPIFFLGAGTNLLIRDAGVSGLVIFVRDRLNKIAQLNADSFHVEAGVNIAKFLQSAITFGMSDAVFLAGIPGTIGGALAMNAGAYGSSIWQHVISVSTINRYGEIRVRYPKEFEIGYRQVKGLNNEWFIGAHLKFTPGDPKKAREKMLPLLKKRRTTQPLDEPNAGSVFRNPPNDFAARLIEAAGLKGCRVGDAEISKKHANFIVNKGKAKSHQVEELMGLIADKVNERFGVKLIPEIHMLGNLEK